MITGVCIACGSKDCKGDLYTFSAKITDNRKIRFDDVGYAVKTTDRELYHVVDFPVFVCSSCTTPPERSRLSKWFVPDEVPDKLALNSVYGRIHALLALSTQINDGVQTEVTVSWIVIRTKNEASDWTRASDINPVDLALGRNTTLVTPSAIPPGKYNLPPLTTLAKLPDFTDITFNRYDYHSLNSCPKLEIDIGNQPGRQFLGLINRVVPIPVDDPSNRQWKYPPTSIAVFDSPQGSYALSLFHDGRGLLLLPDLRMVPIKHDAKIVPN